MLVRNGTCMKCNTCGAFIPEHRNPARLLLQQWAKLVPYKLVPKSGQSRSPSLKHKKPRQHGGAFHFGCRGSRTRHPGTYFARRPPTGRTGGAAASDR